MKFYFPKTPKFVTWLYPKRIWAFSRTKKEIFLTFDDGPIPEVTPWVLDLLKESDAKATFFCIGNNVRKHPYLFQRILDEGHSIGNHTYHHVKGTQTSTTAYLEEVSAFNACVEKPPKLFRPPYGKITSQQAKMLQNKGYSIVMWDVISYDFDRSIPQEKCLKNVLGSMKEGSVIVFHDSLKAEPHLRYTLPKVLEAIHQKGWQAKAIPQDV
jgi:peptidoglycan/xylan/chitin deacetylase (PgdA/CDA1 family)